MPIAGGCRLVPLRITAILQLADADNFRRHMQNDIIRGPGLTDDDWSDDRSLSAVSSRQAIKSLLNCHDFIQRKMHAMGSVRVRRNVPDKRRAKDLRV